ncbi:uncharacterized protein BYT42DRAFT_575065 [Radiomyces spectabilis]|uniref:uncharacterized protein n=1 Tax=Radiomyces spectabilis TaxID=64574 RepID=UPI00221F8831|nr:uncharacterized protein BYT42DRAFT_575065 [Radiomyces spectabilis]KAI8376563.1 hypothetical protein BYT42DRAFT_575065 [Radiomyces spectabilis]
MATAAGGLPLIPLSPTAKASTVCANALSKATDRLAVAKQENPPVPVGTLRRLIEDVRVERHKLDHLTRQMKSVEAATVFNWDPDVLAKQIAVVDCQLFEHVILEKRLLCQADKKSSGVLHLLDFHRYLSHSFAHQLIYWAELTKSGTTVSVVPPVHPKDNLISHLVKVAYLLLHAYRDFSGFAAIMKALMMPEVRRIRKLWHHCSSRTKEMYRELATVVAPANQYHVYHEMLRQKLNIFSRDRQQRHTGVMVAIPWMKPHLESIQSIVTAYAAGGNEDALRAMAASPQDTPEIVLSAPGARKLAVTVALLELCQHNSTTESADLIEDELGLTASTTSTNKRASMATKPIHIEGLRASVVPVPDLTRLAPGDALVHHWLVSRVYLRKDQLTDESIEVEPLLPGEQLEYNPHDEDEQYLQDLAISMSPPRASVHPETETDAHSVELSPIQGVEASASSRPLTLTAADVEKELTTNKDDQESQDSSTDWDGGDGGDFTDDVIVPDPLPPNDTMPSVLFHERGDSPMTPSEDKYAKPASVPPTDGSTDIAILLPAEEEQQPSPPSVTSEHREITTEALASTALRKETPTASASDENTVNDADHPSPEEDKMMTESPAIERQREKSVTGQSMTTVSSQQDSATSKQTKKSRLSPTAPEFVPSKLTQPLLSPQSAHHPRGHGLSSITTSRASSINGAQKDDDNESEKWHGYPGPEPQHGFAKHLNGNIDQPSDEEDEEEVWKGYPGPTESTGSQGSPRRGSSQSETSEEWKGYHASKQEAHWKMEIRLQVQEDDWQGYAFETLNEDELDSSTMMDGELEKSRQARGAPGQDPLESFKRNQLPNNTVPKLASNEIQNGINHVR